MSAPILHGSNDQPDQPPVVGGFALADRSNASGAPGRVHAYYGAKGGVGTTTLAINTASRCTTTWASPSCSSTPT